MTDLNNNKNRTLSESSIYRNHKGKLILPDFIFDIYYKFQSSGKNKPQDFAVFLVTNMAGKHDVMYENNQEVNSETLNYYSGLYMLIEKEGGIDACDMVSDYVEDIKSKNDIEELLKSRKIIKDLVKFDDKGFNIVDSHNNPKVKENSIKSNAIIRNSSGYIVLPDNIYYSYNSFNKDDGYEFAAHVTGVDSSEIKRDVIDYYAALFKLLEKERCFIKLSEFCNSTIFNDTEILTAMLKSDKAKLSLISIDENGFVSEMAADKTLTLDYSIYTINQEKTKVVFKSLQDIKTELEKIEKSLNDIINNCKIVTTEDYKNYKQKFYQVKNKTYSYYKKAKESKMDLESAKYLENKYRDIMNTIDVNIKKIERINDDINKQDEEHKIDYYKHIQAAVEEVEADLSQIIENMSVNSEKDYLAIKSKLSFLQNKLYEIYDDSLEAAQEDGSLTGSIIKEAATKHNAAMKRINKTLDELEELKNKIMFKNIFNT